LPKKSAKGEDTQLVKKGNDVGSSQASGSRSVALSIHPITEAEAEDAARLIARLKRLNGEFDPLLKTTEKAEEEALKTVRKSMSNDRSILLVAAVGRRVVGVVKADLLDRIFYEPRMDGNIAEFYILPEFRRGSLGRDLLAAITDSLRKKGAELITAEFPSQNEIAKRFYTKLGFRSLTNVYAKL
jgi:ribosomal protein S18 acetylase RimI-like enzyme